MNGLSKISIVLLIISLIVILSTTVLGYDMYEPTEFNTSIDTGATGTGKIKTTGGKIVGLIQIVGTIAAVGMLVVLGIKYMMGSAEERAEYKKTMFPYIIGATVLFAAANLTQVIYTWAEAI